MDGTGPLRLGAAQIVEPSTREVIGYAYTVEDGGGQMQRWLLYRHPENTFDVLAPPPDMAGWTLEQWQSKVPELWRPGSFYVRALVRVYRYGEIYRNVAWTTIPSARALPPPEYPKVPGVDYQLDPTGWRVMDVIRGAARGIAFTVSGLLDETNAEYWMLPSSGSPEVDDVLAVTPGAMEARSLQEFVDVANLAWGPGCALAIVGCVNYRGDRAPSEP